MPMVNGIPYWVVRKAKIQVEEEKLAEDFQKIAKQEVIHMPKPKLQAWVTTLEQEPVEIIDLNPTVFNQEIRKDIIHRVVRFQRNMWRVGLAKGKRRSEVRGGGVKPRPQKGTGQARQGSIRSPLWVGGGKAFPPVIRDYSHDLPKKVVKKGVMIALSAKFKEGNLFVIDNCSADTARTKDLAQKFSMWDTGDVAFVYGKDELDPNFALAARNIGHVELYTSREIGVYQIVKRHQVMITRQGLRELEEHLTALPGNHVARRLLAPTPEGFVPTKLTDLYL